MCLLMQRYDIRGSVINFAKSSRIFSAVIAAGRRSTYVHTYERMSVRTHRLHRNLSLAAMINNARGPGRDISAHNDVITGLRTWVRARKATPYPGSVSLRARRLIIPKETNDAWPPSPDGWKTGRPRSY